MLPKHAHSIPQPVEYVNNKFVRHRMLKVWKYYSLRKKKKNTFNIKRCRTK
jgi:hypothetical protein